MKLMLDILDSATTCVQQTFPIHFSDIEELKAMLDISDLMPGAMHELSGPYLTAICKRFNVPFVTDDNSAILRSYNWMDDLPYLVHTNRELLLMLKGAKPFAAFAEAYSEGNHATVFSEEVFDKYVAEEKFVKREYVEIFQNNKIRRVFFALPKEFWRIDAYILMLEIVRTSGWNEGFERMEGRLLGYEDWECSAFFEAKKQHIKLKPPQL